MNVGHPLPETHKITSTLGNNYHYGDHVEMGQFAFTVPEAGDYMACYFDWRSGISAKDCPNLFMEMELKKLEDGIRSIHDEMICLQMQGINQASNFKMAWLGFLLLFVCLSVAGLQLWYLKNFIERKKLL
ncbi:hypothetical protein MKX03_029637 [Papaver bracteatum]|nr:hypothetical protein MKX03_029637 [Papaver bracteatum]